MKKIPTFLHLLWLLGLAVPCGFGQLPYERDYPVINYYAVDASGELADFFGQLESGVLSLAYDPVYGYLPAVLEALNIDVSSQLLVFSQTARKRRFISSVNPRAIYFNDQIYVGYVPQTNGLEFAAMDPVLGPVFFELAEAQDGRLDIKRQTSLCLRCHDSLTNSGGGTPRFMMNSVLVDETGAIVSHEISLVTENSTPLERRWGGWYVSGMHGSQQTLGNYMYRPGETFNEADFLSYGNIPDISNLLDTSSYLSPFSDIVALMVMQHQIEVQNLLTRVSWNYQQELAEQGGMAEVALKELARPLLDALLMANEATLGDTISGTSGFSEYFQALGPADSKGRSLRQLDMQERVFSYPLSYLIYSDAFAALPQGLYDYLRENIQRILVTLEDPEDYPYLDLATRRAILEIVNETAPGFFL
jgi:hypothetical protein